AILPRRDPNSPVFETQVPSTCGTCHQGVADAYRGGIHAAALADGNPAAPQCATCHTAHTIQRIDSEPWKLSVTNECGACHSQVVDSFRRTFHGKVNQLGFGSAAACADCHGAHGVQPASNPASTIAPGNLVTTCAKCHAGANARFVEYDPHPDPRNYARSPVLWWANRLYTVLIAGCFGFFALHSGLWFWRSRRERRRTTPGHSA
ncbi:MAG: cytochrome c3 family protein, partial [Vicinamibacterales bacterium]